MSEACCEECSGTLCPGDVFCGACGRECDPDRARGFTIRRRVIRGDTIQIDYDLVDSNGTPIDLSNPLVKIWFTVKYWLRDADVYALAQPTLANGGILPRDVAASGHIRVTIASTVTQYIAEGTTKLYYDLQVLDSTGTVTTLERGLFMVDPDVSRATS
jgi:hypothetical protein